MANQVLTSDPSKISFAAAKIAKISALAVILLLVTLHFLSPEFDPAWRVISEYALGDYGWVLSLMFIFGAINAWALFFAIKSQIQTKAGKVGLFLLIFAGFGPAMAAYFTIPNPIHDIAGVIGVFTLPVAAMLISVSLSRTKPWSEHKKTLLWTANFTWISVLLFIIAMVVLISTYMQSGGDMTNVDPAARYKTLPDGVIAINGWTNRLILVASSLWVVTVSWIAIKLRKRK